MTNSLIPITLYTQEIEYLCNAEFLDRKYLEIFHEARVINDVFSEILISRELSEEFRDIFTNQLAKVGFDENYEVTTEGQMLETLIDKFFIES